MSISKAIIGDFIIGLYTLSQDIYMAHFLQQFDIYKYLRIQTIIIQMYNKNSKIFSFKTPPLACQISIHGQKLKVYGDFALKVLKVSRMITLKKLC